MNYEHLIDPTQFSTVARYLNHPESGIHYVLHVKDRDMLPELAEKLHKSITQAGTLGGEAAIRVL